MHDKGHPSLSAKKASYERRVTATPRTYKEGDGKNVEMAITVKEKLLTIATKGEETILQTTRTVSLLPRTAAYISHESNDIIKDFI